MFALTVTTLIVLDLYLFTSCSGKQSIHTTSNTSMNHAFSSKHHLISESSYKHQENVAELYYQNQLHERTKSENYTLFVHLNANYPCIHGTSPAGTASSASIDDGHKFVCGIHRIKSSPIVYSFGSNKQQDFEESILYYRPDSKILTYDILESNLPDRRDMNPNITYIVAGLGPSNGKVTPKMMLINEMMRENNHSYVDILKLDVEGAEYPWIDVEPLDTFDRIGQLLIEVHSSNVVGEPVAHPQIKRFIEALEKRNLRIFHKELNFWREDPCCMEFALIRSGWGDWNSVHKFNLTALNKSNNVPKSKDNQKNLKNLKNHNMFKNFNMFKPV
mmetsp:Transcript_23138/g.22294  ORF Transcript_23138/g.22294 Transcript_23138/m.22294 type:complete len:332 (-) Transcript_23138:80-1075(-)